jgi:hypothetical protein
MLLLLLSLSLALAQSAAPAAAPGAATVSGALVDINSELSANRSLSRPCLSSSRLELSADGWVTVTTTRSGYCEDSRIIAHLTELDPASVAVEDGEVAVVRIACSGGTPCARYAMRRKKYASGQGWTARDTDWRTDVSLGPPHQAVGLELEMASNPRSTDRVARALSWMAGSAPSLPEYQRPPDLYGGGGGEQTEE